MTQQEHEFTLTLPNITDLTPDVLDSLYESGCDDALIGMRDGIAFADFCRPGTSFREAVLSAIRDVEKAGVAAKLEEYHCVSSPPTQRFRGAISR